MTTISFEKERELEAFVEYLNQINHGYGEGAKVAADTIEVKVGERVLSLPLNYETFDVFFDALYNLLHD